MYNNVEIFQKQYVESNANLISSIPTTILAIVIGSNHSARRLTTNLEATSSAQLHFHRLLTHFDRWSQFCPVGVPLSGLQIAEVRCPHVIVHVVTSVGSAYVLAQNRHLNRRTTFGLSSFFSGPTVADEEVDAVGEDDDAAPTLTVVDAGAGVSLLDFDAEFRNSFSRLTEVRRETVLRMARTPGFSRFVRSLTSSLCCCF